MMLTTEMVIKYSKAIFVAGFVAGALGTALWLIK